MTLPPPPTTLELFRKFIRFGSVTRPLFGLFLTLFNAKIQFLASRSIFLGFFADST